MHGATSVLARAQYERPKEVPVRLVSSVAPIDIAASTFHRQLLGQLESEQHNHSRTIIDVDSSQHYTYAHLAKSIRRAAAFLRHQVGVQPEDYVLFYGSTSFQYLSLYFATIALGAVPVQVPSVNYLLLNIQTKLIQLDIRLIVCHSSVDRDNLAKLLNSMSFVEHVILYGSVSSAKESMAKEWSKITLYKDHLNDGEELSTEDLFCTSTPSSKKCLVVNTNGTSGWPPRMLLYGHQALVEACQVLSHPSVLKHRPGDTLLVYGSFEHIENVTMFLSGIFTASNVVLLPEYDYKSMTRAIVEHKVKMAWMSSVTLARLINDADIDLALDGLMKIIVFGGQCPMSQCLKAFIRFPSIKSIRSCYLVAESAYPLTIMQLNSKDYDSVGHVMANTEMMMIEAIDSQFACEMNKAGVICAKRNQEAWALGYLRGRVLEPLRWLAVEGETPEMKGNQVWLQTLDYGYYDHNYLVHLHGHCIDETMETERAAKTLATINTIEEILWSHQFVEESLVLAHYNLWIALIKPKLSLGSHNRNEVLLEISKYLHTKLSHTGHVHNIETLIFFTADSPAIYSTSGRFITSLARNHVKDMLSKKCKY